MPSRKHVTGLLGFVGCFRDRFHAGGCGAAATVALRRGHRRYLVRVVTGRVTLTRRWALTVAGATVPLGVLACAKWPSLVQPLLYLLPALLLLLALASRLYPGERALLRLVGRGRPGRRHALDVCGFRRSRPRALVPRGGRLIAFSL